MRSSIPVTCIFIRSDNEWASTRSPSIAHQFGLGEETGIEFPSERVGIVPSTEWKQKAKHEQWLPGETISAAIGQGYVTVTPLQMAELDRYGGE